jgi:two-component system phosphate regulon response regulator PhoB
MDVLVVDDDADLREMVLLVLDDAGFSALGLPDARTLVETARSERPALVLLDLSMPGLDPPAVVKQVRGLADGPAIVALSGRCDAEVVARELSLDGLLPKPFASEALVSEVGRHCLHRASGESGPRPAPSAL